MCLRGFERDSEEHARALPSCAARARAVSNPAKATHVVVPDDPPLKELKELKELRDRVVHLTWLEACEAEARVADEEPHLVAPSLFVAAAARGASEKRDENAETNALAASLRTGRTDICRAVSARRRAAARTARPSASRGGAAATPRRPTR